MELAQLQIRGDPHLNVRASFSLSLALLDPQEIDFFTCLSVCAQDGFSIRAATAAGDCAKPVAEERVSYLYRLSLLNRPQSRTDQFVFHPLIRLFAQELAHDRNTQDIAAERHACFFVELVKSTALDDRDAVSVVVEELDDILLAAQWLQRQERADYEFVIRLEPFFQRYGRWEEATRLMSGFLALAERIEDWTAVVQLCIQQAKFLSLRGEWVRAEETLFIVSKAVDRIETRTVRQHCEAMWLNTLGGVLQRQGKLEEAITAFQQSYELLVSVGDERGQAMVLNSLGGVYQRQGKFDEAVTAFQQSYMMLVTMGDKLGQAMVQFAYGKALLSRQFWKEAAVKLCASFEINEHLKNRQGMRIVTPSLVRALTAIEQTEEAQEYCRRALAIVPDDKRLLRLQEQLLQKHPVSTQAMLKTGRIKRTIRNVAGYLYGFIVPDDGGKDIYFGENQVDPDLLPHLAEGLPVVAEVELTARGPRARRVYQRNE